MERFTPKDTDREFRRLIDQARATRIDGWHFDFLRGRVVHGELPWNFEDLAAQRVGAATTVVDVDTGGGEVFARLAPPSGSWAVEDWPPNIPLARQRLQPLGVTVTSRRQGRLPIEDAGVDLVLNRHGDLDFEESARILATGGVLLSQQVAAGNDVELNDAFGVPATPYAHAVTDICDLRARATRAGFDVKYAAQAMTTTRYLDVGAVVLQLRAVPWQVPGFDVFGHMPVLREIHRHIQRHGSFAVHSVRLLLCALRAPDERLPASGC